MTYTAAVVAQRYRQTEIQSRSPVELVIMLYEGATRSLAQARAAIQQQNGDAKREAISRALAIVAELQNILDVDQGGEIAASLDSLYYFVNERIIDANQRNDIRALDEAIRVLTPLHEAWAQLARSPASGDTR